MPPHQVELVNAQIFDRLGTNPRFYGMVRLEDGRIGYVLQIVPGVSADLDMDIQEHPDFTQIADRVYTAGLTQSSLVKTPSGHLVTIDAGNALISSAEKRSKFIRLSSQGDNQTPAGLEEKPTTAEAPRLASDLQGFSGQAALTPASFPEGTFTLVDFTGLEEAGQLLVPYLPQNAMAILSSRQNLLVAVQASPGRQIPTKQLIFLGDYQGDFSRAFRATLSRLPKGLKELRILTGRSGETSSALASLGGIDFTPLVIPVSSLRQIIQALWIGDSARSSLEALIERAASNWAGLEEYL